MWAAWNNSNRLRFSQIGIYRLLFLFCLGRTTNSWSWSKSRISVFAKGLQIANFHWSIWNSWSDWFWNTASFAKVIFSTWRLFCLLRLWKHSTYNQSGQDPTRWLLVFLCPAMLRSSSYKSISSVRWWQPLEYLVNLQFSISIKLSFLRTEFWFRRSSKNSPI